VFGVKSPCKVRTFCTSACAEKYRYALPRAFWEKVNKSGECWLWNGSTNHGGYGQTYMKYRPVSAHRLAWTLEYGPIPDGAWVLHRCDTRNCVRPEHLFLGTPKDNTQDMLAKGRHRNQHHSKTHCPHGHPYEGRNLIVSVKGWRYCRTCREARARAQCEQQRSAGTQADLDRPSLQAEALRRWPSASTGEKCCGVMFGNAAKQGVL
jgi:hypothetical protein